MKILITSPSLDERENVSGISTMIREISARTKDELVHFQAGRKDGEAASVGWLLDQAALPVRFFRRLRAEKPDVVHINTAFIKLAILRDTALVLAARISGYPLILHIHGGPYVMSRFSNPLLRAIAHRMVAMSDRLIATSKVERDFLASRFPAATIDALPNAIALDSVEPRESASDVRTVIFFARHHHSKGLSHVIEATRELVAAGVPMKFTCYGTGPDSDWFVGEMTEVLGDNFHYGGVLAGREKWIALSQADIFFLPSHYEGLPFALLEAMASGCIPVMTDSGGVATVIEDGHNGFIIKAGQREQTVAKLKALLSPQTDLEPLRENARRTIEENFNMADYTERLEKVYADVAQSKKVDE